MTDVYQAYQEVLSRVNKEEAGYLPEALFNTYAIAADRLVFNSYNDRLQNPQTTAVEKGKLLDRMSPFNMKSTRAAIKGLFDLPADYAYFRAAKIRYDGGAAAVQVFHLQSLICEAENDPTINKADIQHQLDLLLATDSLVGVELLDQDQVSKRINSHIPGKRPSLKKPIMERAPMGFKQGFQVYPSSDLSVFLDYYRRPKPPTLVMTPHPTTGYPQYSLAGSTQFEWESEGMADVLDKITADFSVYIRESGLLQMVGSEPK